jgi:hypothetical protein
VFRISQDGFRTHLAWVPNIISVRVGPDGMFYAADTHHVHRIDPMTGAKEVWLSDLDAKVLDSGPGGELAYAGTIGRAGTVWSVVLDERFDPVGEQVCWPARRTFGTTDWRWMSAATSLWQNTTQEACTESAVLGV